MKHCIDCGNEVKILYECSKLRKFGKHFAFGLSKKYNRTSLCYDCIATHIRKCLTIKHKFDIEIWDNEFDIEIWDNE